MTLELRDIEVDFSIDIEPDTTTHEPKRKRLTDEDQLYLWCLLLQNNLVGQISPGNGKDRRSKVKYACLLPDSLIVNEINRVSDVEITGDMLRAIVRRFQGTKPPYDSSDLPPARGTKYGE